MVYRKRYTILNLYINDSIYKELVELKDIYYSEKIERYFG